ncbi:Retrovirus-related Pol polyprotein from transposon TNT 1-94 [Cucumis melo var. makuwa]|uniref:Retrovirus-related Pol polyprotein from transposon TNT 1-94 n=1 Tax=Cucumis melo var. makuwa TaxID=1194695 RepID=A0A5D3BX40_CUCMM|nr:Retrovirus-related Pol polyprotein from transposon TNT 1-94 [Cucumis melo var. makuwa]TYK03690.1 Retrovirus-related Pol polyprotein from transposon TNT 1-94 [Cucumis melo var. makuwa]
MTPQEAWDGCKPSVDRFKVFGCIAYAHIPDEKRRKLDDKEDILEQKTVLENLEDSNESLSPQLEDLVQQSVKLEATESQTGATSCSRSQRVRRRPAWMEDYEQAMHEEIKSIEKSNTWKLSELSRGQKSIGVKWAYKTKLNKDSQVNKYKARLVRKGYKQQIGIDYNEVFAPVARHDTI